jgi:predicted dienelactone hydrolase
LLITGCVKAWCLGALLLPGLASAKDESPDREHGSAPSQESSAQSSREEIFSELTGPYPVGTQDFFWVDENRPETATRDPDDLRHLFVKVWYPAVVGKSHSLAPYIPGADEFEEDAKKIFAPANGLDSRSFLDAPLLRGDQKLPVLLYNHGGSWSRFTSSFVTENLASQGYVVFSIDHTGFNKSTRFPDGYVFKNELMKPPGKDDELSAAENGKRFFEYLEDKLFPVWVQDGIFVLDRITELDSAPDGMFSNALAVDRVGAFGWSFGGATAVQLSLDDPRVIAALDHDGQLFGSVIVKGTSRPVMLLHTDEDMNPDNDPGLQQLIDSVMDLNDTMVSRSTGDWYQITISGSNHGSFSDLAFFWPPDQNREAIESVRRMHNIINDLTVQFFDHYLRGYPKGLLLSGVLDNYPELEFSSGR